MPQSMANFDAALKDFYGPGLKNAINNSNPILTEATKNDEDIVGRKAVWAIHTGRSSSTSARGELGALASADRQRFTQAFESLDFLYHTIKVSGQAKHLTSNDQAAFTRALEAEIDGAERDLKNDVSRQCFGQKVTVNGVLASGVLATVTAAAGSTITVANESTATMRHFFAGMVVQAIVPATGATRTAGPYTVVSVNATTKVITFSAAIDASVVATDVLVRSGAVATSAALTNLSNEFNGLRYLFGTQVFANIDPASVPSWQAVQVGSATTGISEVIIDQAVEGVETDGNGETPSLIVAEHAQRRKLASLMQSQKRFDGKQVTLEAGWQGLQLARAVLVADRYNPSNLAFVINPKYLVRFVGLDWTWDDDDGKVLFKALDGSDAVEARFKTYMNLVTTVRNAHSLITLAEPTF
jgi:hypothetical protein